MSVSDMNVSNNAEFSAIRIRLALDMVPNWGLQFNWQDHIVWYEPTDIQKASKPWRAGKGDKVSFSSPNLNELRSICKHLSLGELPPHDHVTEGEELTDLLGAIVRTAAPLLDTMSALMVTLGPQGFMILRKASPEKSNDPLLLLPPAPPSSDRVIGLHFPGLKNPKIVSVSGAGD
ncbi:uncharacterized protein LOC134789054, partial [Penaeus indicus]|uniref:uncharacterized protein LOC134789054 n=1 Tax=Penaeus indicus TaxID=29960 RepID=UPI00300C0AEE